MRTFVFVEKEKELEEVEEMESRGENPWRKGKREGEEWRDFAGRDWKGWEER